MIEGWNFDMSAAPRDNTLLLLLLDFTPQDDDAPAAILGNGIDIEETPPLSRALGCNNFDNDGTDEWNYTGWDWSNDGFEAGSGGRPIAWRHIAPPVRAEDLINAGIPCPWAERIFREIEDVSGYGLDRSRLPQERDAPLAAGKPPQSSKKE